MISLTNLGINALSRLAKELNVKISDCTDADVPWDQIIAPYQKKEGAESFSTDLYLWSWKEGLVEKIETDARIQVKADFALYRVRYLVSCELKKIPNLSHIAIHQVKVTTSGKNQKTEETFRVYLFNKKSFQES